MAVLASLSAGLPSDRRGHAGVIAGVVAVVLAVGGREVPVSPRAVIDAYGSGLATPDREGLASRIQALPVAEQVEAWTRLARAHPSQPWLAWRRALALADAGELAHGLRVLETGPWPRHPLRRAGMPALSFVGGDAPLEWSARGFAVYAVGGLRSRPLLPGEAASLALDADRFDGEGALARVSWLPDCGAGAVDVRVAGPRRFALVPPCAAADRIEVRFVDDASGPAGDRNLYASLSEGAGEALPPWSWRPFAGDALPDAVDWVAGRGFGMWANGELRSRVLRDPVLLKLDADAPGGEPALAQVLWEPACGTSPVEVEVPAPTQLAMAPGCPSALVIRYTNDAVTAAGDRNLYVGLAPAL